MVRVPSPAPQLQPWFCFCYLHTLSGKVRDPAVVKEATWRRRVPTGHSSQPAPSHRLRSGSQLLGRRPGLSWPAPHRFLF